jgi:UDP-GlcNAc:undecaprenyl-phosphate GlcNAc-1-phosphate transferase
VAVVLGGYLLGPRLLEWPELPGFADPVLRFFRTADRISGRLAGILLGGSLVFVAGILDDFLSARFHWVLKLCGQVLGAIIVVASGVHTTFLPWSWLNWLVTVVWIVGITNAFNLLDNMDGLSAGVAFVASSVLLVNAWWRGEVFVSLILVAFIGTLFGFLLFNFEPASVFLGDCGSLFIGFMMATLTLLERYVTTASSSYFPVVMPVVLLAVPLTDTLTVIAIRVRDGRPVYVGDSSHLSHRLVALGFTKREAVLFIYLATFCLGAGAALLPDASLGETVLLAAQAVGIVLLILRLMFIERGP